MLHCAKMRGAGRGGHFVPAHAGTTKLTAGPCNVSLSPGRSRFASPQPCLYEWVRAPLPEPKASHDAPIRHASTTNTTWPEPRLRHRLSGADPRAADAAGARPPRRAQHRGLRHRLSRLAARRARPAVRCAPAASSPPHDIVFQPGLNEDLAATALWGSQQAELRGEGKYDGVFGIWYGKGPGVDRSGDVFRHANFAGTSKHGGVLALMGDDHTAESSTTAHQSEFHFVDVMIPILNPAGRAGDHRLRRSTAGRCRASPAPGSALKCMHETVESTAVDRRQPRPRRRSSRRPISSCRRAGSTSASSTPSSARKRGCTTTSATPCSPSCAPTSSTGSSPPAAATRRSASSPPARAISTCARRSTSSASTRCKCNDLGMRAVQGRLPVAARAGRSCVEFAQGLDLIIVVEEKRSLIEVQVREELYGTANQPICIGKKDEQGNWLFPVKGALDPNDIAIAHRRAAAAATAPTTSSPASVARLKEAQRALAETHGRRRAHALFLLRLPAQHLDRGAGRLARLCRHRLPLHGAVDGPQHRSASRRWAARAPTGSARRRSPSATHVFQNLGDGTYNHSGSLAIRAAIAAGVNITYKILFNDAVAMTGGQRHDGGLTVPQIARQVAAEGVERVVVVTDEPEKYAADTDWPRGLTVHHRDELDAVQRELRDSAGRHGADLRPDLRRREAPPPQARHLPRSRQARHHQRAGLRRLRRLRRASRTASRCSRWRPSSAASAPSTSRAATRTISCVKGFCPSFVTVHGAKLKKGESVAEPADLGGAARAGDAARPTSPTASSSPASAAPASSPSAPSSAWPRISKARASASSTWPASRRRAARSSATSASPARRTTSTPSASRPAAPTWCSAATSSSPATRRCSARSSRATPRVVVNTAEVLPGDFTRNADFSLPTERLKRAITGAAGASSSAFRRRDAARHRAARQFDRRQHVHARLRLSARRAAAVGRGDRAGDRAQRRGGGDEHRRLPLGPPRRARSGRGRGAGRAGAAAARTTRCKLSRDARRDGRAARRPSSPPIRTRAYARRYRELVEQGARRPKPRRRRARAGSPRRSRAICSS